MNKRLLRLAAICPAALALAGCSSLGINFNEDKVHYDSAASESNLEIPPDLAQLPVDNRFEVPSRLGVASANAEAARLAAVGKVVQEQGKVVQRTEIAKLMKDGNVRWLRVNEDASQLWPVIQDFWSSQGLSIASENARTGYLETGWAENKAKLPQDIIRQTLGKVIDFAYSTGERDSYRCRVERNPDGTSDVFVTHRSMLEVLTGSDKETSKWVPGPADPMLEVEMLRRMAVRIENEFNPQIRRTVEEHAKDLPVADVTPAVALSDVAKDAEGNIAALTINEPFDRAWRTMGLVVDRMGFDLADRDRSAGYYLVSYLDPTYEEHVKSQRGVFEKVFKSDKPIDVPQYRIQLVDEQGRTGVKVLGADGGPDETGVANRILTLLAEQLR